LLLLESGRTQKGL